MYFPWANSMTYFNLFGCLVQQIPHSAFQTLIPFDGRAPPSLVPDTQSFNNVEKIIDDEFDEGGGKRSGGTQEESSSSESKPEEPN